jgi:hypothetical protein
MNATHLAAFSELLAEGAEPLLIRGALHVRGSPSAHAKALLEAHGEDVIELLQELGAGSITRQGLARELAPGFSWPGTLDRVPEYPGPQAFVLGVEMRHCRDCVRFSADTCGRYSYVPGHGDGADFVPPQASSAFTGRLNRRGVRCIAFVPKEA